MELLTHKDKDTEHSYYLDKNGFWVVHGEYKRFHSNGQLWVHSFSYHGKLHGECKEWDENGELLPHILYINNKRFPYVEMTKQEKLLFQIQHPGFQFFDDV